MSRALANVAVNAQFQVWYNTTNFLATYMSSEVVTCNTAGGVTTGNGHVNGNFSAVVLAANSYQGGNNSSSANATFTSNVNFTGASVSINNTYYLTVNATTSGLSAQVIDSFLLSSYRGGEYFLSIKNTAANGYQISKILMVHDGTNATITEYAIVQSNGNLGTFSASSNSTTTILNFTPAAAVTSSTIQGSKRLVSV